MLPTLRKQIKSHTIISITKGEIIEKSNNREALAAASLFILTQPSLAKDTYPDAGSIKVDDAAFMITSFLGLPMAANTWAK